MKRNREDAQPTGAGKRRSASSKPAPAPAQPPAAGARLTTTDALSYLREVKTRFSDRKDVYDTFLEIMKEFKACKIDTNGVIYKVKLLFKGHNELILGFNTFLPRDHQIDVKDLTEPEKDTEKKQCTCGKGKSEEPVQFDQAINYVNKVKTRFADKGETYKAFLDILNQYRRSQKNIDQVYDEITALFADHQDLKDEFLLFLPNPELANRQSWGTKNQPKQKGPEGAAEGRNLRPQHKRKSKSDGGYRRDGDDEEDMTRGPGRPQLAKELSFFERAKQRLRNKDAYSDFLKCLGLYTQEVISRQELLQLLSDIMGRYPDLMNGFHEFIAKCDHMEVDEQAIREQVEQQRRKDEERQRRKYLTKPLSEIVAGEKKRVTPSYVKMPPGYPHVVCSGRTPLVESVLNSEFVNVITGSEDYSFKLMRKNQYEEALFRCEDDRYDFEIAIERNVATMKRLKPVADKLATMTAEERANFKLDAGLLGPVHWRSIENLYGDQGPAIVDQMRRSPAVVIPILVVRMEQKDLEWRRVLAEMTVTWREIYEANYHKSLDHRSFYFKQAEKKALMPKTLVAEVREAAERRRQDARSLRSVCPAYRHEALVEPSAGDLSFDYSEKAVFGDIYRILRTAMEETLSGGSREQVLELYLSLLEPFFGQEVRQAELDAVRQALAESEDDGDAAGSRPAGAAAGGRGRGGARNRGVGQDRNGQQQQQQPAAQQQQPPRGTAGGARRGGGGADASAQSEGSDQEGARTEPDVSPEPGAAADGGREGTAGASDRDLDDDETSADAGRGQGEDSAGAAGTAGAARARAGISDRQERAYATCKPLAAYTGSDTSRNAPAGLQLLFGNENIYVFYRYHRILFERLCTARKCVQTKCNADAAESLRQQQADAGRGGTVTPEPPQARAAAFEKLHESFMSMLLEVIRGQLDSSAYEDECRSALGTSSYELFTLDKLSAKIVKHMQLMLQDDATAKLWALYKYERARGVPIHSTLYHVNCHAVLTEDPCYRIAYNTASAALHITLVEPDRAPEAMGGAAEGCVTDYIREYVSAPTPAQSAELQLYLRRNLAQRARQSPDAELVGVLASVALCNCLECRINRKTSQLSYVAHTEDVLCRKPQLRRHELDSQKQLRSVRFERWASTRNPQPAEGPSSARDDAMDAVMALAGIAPGSSLAEQ